MIFRGGAFGVFGFNAFSLIGQNAERKGREEEEGEGAVVDVALFPPRHGREAGRTTVQVAIKKRQSDKTKSRQHAKSETDQNIVRSDGVHGGAPAQSGSLEQTLSCKHEGTHMHTHTRLCSTQSPSGSLRAS